MWRLCDLHVHTCPNEQDDSPWDPDEFLRACQTAGLGVVAITDHNSCSPAIEFATSASSEDLVFVPGTEIDTDRGHIVVLAPGPDGPEVLSSFMARIGAQSSPTWSVDFEELVAAASADAFSDSLLLIGAHVDREASLLATGNPLGIDAQLRLAGRLSALEVTDPERLRQWATSGVKDSPEARYPLIQSSDSHRTASIGSRATWLYLPEVTARQMRHAFAIPEASIRLDQPGPTPQYVIEEVRIEGGFHDGVTIEFDERVTAIVGPPNSGKSLLIDAIRFVFDLQCPIPEVETNAHSRMKACLPAGSTVVARVSAPEGNEILIERQVGADQKPTPPFRPIVFSQTELVRRAHEASPATKLIDVHVDDVESLVGALESTETAIQEAFETAWATAADANAIATQLENPIDGLKATEDELKELTGAEEIAQKAVDAKRVRRWRSETREVIAAWAEDFDLGQIPELPEPPAMTKEVTAGFTPRQELTKLTTAFAGELGKAVAGLRGDLMKLLDDSEPAFEAFEKAQAEALESAGFEAGEEFFEKLHRLQERQVLLEVEKAKLAGHDSDLAEHIDELDRLVDRGEQQYEALRLARKDACRRVNESMRTFFAMITEDSDTSKLDALIDDLKTGTGKWADTLRVVRDSLDRKRLLLVALRVRRGTHTEEPEDSSMRDQDDIIVEAVQRDKRESIARLAATWPEDVLDIGLLRQGQKTPSMFRELTEGLRALAIKEISFADSKLPVISDQPEDAVPAKSVFDSIVPTLRDQRPQRQFILVSHDANVVVAGDVERIWLLGAGQSAPPVVGTLFDGAILESALDLLEGGQEAFRRRQRRYFPNASGP